MFLVDVSRIEIRRAVEGMAIRFYGVSVDLVRVDDIGSCLFESQAYASDTREQTGNSVSV